MIMISNYLFNFISFCVIVSFFDLITSFRLLFSTALREALVAKLVLLGISPLTSFILTSREVIVAKLVTSGI